MLTPEHLEQYVRVKADPAQRCHLPLDEALILMEAVERRLALLKDVDARIALLEAEGWTQREIAGLLGIGLRTVTRRVVKIRCDLYGELAHWLERRVKRRQVASLGTQFGRARKAA